MKDFRFSCMKKRCIIETDGKQELMTHKIIRFI